MKSVLVLLVFSIFATPRESFAELGPVGLAVTGLTNHVGLSPFDKSEILREKANAKSNINKFSIDVFKWIDDQCVRQKCEWIIPKTHIDRCRSAVQNMKNCIDTEWKNMGRNLNGIYEDFESAVHAFEKSIPKKTDKNQACHEIMGKIYAMLSKMLTDCKREAVQCERSVSARLKKQKSIL